MIGAFEVMIGFLVMLGMMAAGIHVAVAIFSVAA